MVIWDGEALATPFVPGSYVGRGAKGLSGGKKATKSISNSKTMSWNAFQSANVGKYNEVGMSSAWKQYKDANGIVSGTSSNMRLLDEAFHKLHLSKGFYRPWQ